MNYNYGWSSKIISNAASCTFCNHNISLSAPQISLAIQTVSVVWSDIKGNAFKEQFVLNID